MKQYVVDAFTKEVFRGNPAAVCVMEAWLPDGVMQSIAIENQLSETAFAVRQNGRYGLRWFTPGGEINLCGHATLATAYVILRFYEPDASEVSFNTLSGVLTVTKRGERYEMEFPAYALNEVPVTDEMEAAIGVRPLAAYMDRDLLCVLPDEEAVRQAAPDKEKTLALPGLLLNITAAGTDYDCVSRSFAPKLSVWEDPVCGSAHCQIFPYWGRALGKAEISGWQASARGGAIRGRLEGGKVYLSGEAALFSEGEIYPEGH